MITLQFVRGQDFGAHAIEWFAHGADFSHVDTVMPDGRLLGARSDVVGGAPAGVQIRDPSYTGKEVTLRIDLVVSIGMEKSYMDFIQAQIGKPYDEAGIVGFIAGRNWDLPDAWFCSELVAAGLQRCGYFPYPLATPSNKITPPDLILILSARTRVLLPTS